MHFQDLMNVFYTWAKPFLWTNKIPDDNNSIDSPMIYMSIANQTRITEKKSFNKNNTLQNAMLSP